MNRNFVLFTHFGVTTGITQGFRVIPDEVTPKWVNNTNVHSKFTLISLFSKIHSLKSEHIHSFLFREYNCYRAQIFMKFLMQLALHIKKKLKNAVKVSELNVFQLRNKKDKFFFFFFFFFFFAISNFIIVFNDDFFFFLSMSTFFKDLPQYLSITLPRHCSIT